MISTTSDTGAGPGGFSRNRVSWLASVALCGVLPAVVLVTLFAATIADDSIAFDFRPFHRAAEAILAGASPYPGSNDPLTAAAGPYVYPPLPALLAIPASWLPFDAAGFLVMAALVGAAAATLWLLEVRDWRCYGVALLWPPVLSAIQTGNVTLWLGLAAAIAWRFRDRSHIAGPAVGVTLAVKLFFWPLVVWFASTRRVGAAAYAAAVGMALLVLSWAVIGFTGLRSYPHLLQRLEDTVGADSYTIHVVGLDLGLSTSLARGVWLAMGMCLLAAVIVLARRGKETASFVLAIVAAISLTPIVWLHYFSLLLVVVALAERRLGIVWFVPLGMAITPGSGQPSPFETAWTLGIAVLTVALALHRLGGGRFGRSPRPSSVGAAR